MNFKGYIQEQEGFFDWISSKLQTIKTHLFSAFSWLKRNILSSAHSEEDSVRFSFPDDFTNFFAGLSNENHQDRIAAIANRIKNAPITVKHYDDSPYPYYKVEEGYPSHKYGKGGVAFDSIQQSRFARNLTPKQSFNFQRGLTAHIKDVAKEMGLIFELELYVYMLTKKKLISSDPTVNLSWAKNEINRHYGTIKGKTGDNFVQMLMSFISHHASDLAEHIYQKAVNLLSAPPDTVIFTGGNPLGIDKKGHRITSDLILKCKNRGRNELGFTTKFTSESEVRIGDFWVPQIYAMLGGKQVSQLKDELEQIKTSDADQFKQEYRHIVLEKLETLLKDIASKPAKLNFLINKLLFGTETSHNGITSKDTISDVLPAFRNYVYNKGNVNFSDALKKDFNVSEEQGNKLFVKKESEISVRKTEVAVLVKIQNIAEKSRGTYLKFQVEPLKQEVMVKMNNLA